MISFEEARRIVLDAAGKGIPERIRFAESLGRVLAEDIYAMDNVPPFDKSAMDGYACRRADISSPLEVIGTVAAGDDAPWAVGERQCLRIMTGARIPQGADLVLIKEDVEPEAPGYVRFRGHSTKTNICYRGEDILKGSLLLARGTLINPARIALLASNGSTMPLVYPKPRIGVLVTGTELVEPDVTPHPTQIRNSNAYSILAQLQSVSLDASNYGIVADDRDKLERTILFALEENDVLILSGAVSVGDFDFVPGIIEKMGARTHFHGINVKPGKRMLFATLGERFVFALPGNPVSTFMLMQELVLPFLQKCCGNDGIRKSRICPLGFEYSRSKADKTEFVPCRINEEGELIAVDYNGSAHLHAIGLAEGFLEVPEGITHLSRSSQVIFLPFS